MFSLKDRTSKVTIKEIQLPDWFSSIMTELKKKVWMTLVMISEEFLKSRKTLNLNVTTVNERLEA